MLTSRLRMTPISTSARCAPSNLVLQRIGSSLAPDSDP
jgi:hypothetical protein